MMTRKNVSDSMRTISRGRELTCIAEVD